MRQLKLLQRILGMNFWPFLIIMLRLEPYKSGKNTVQCPYLTNETKLLQAERETLQKEASKNGDSLLLKEFKIKSKEVFKKQ